MLKSVHRAKYVLAEPDLLLQNAAVHVSNPGRISRVEPWADPPAVPGVEVTDWESAAIIPGFINAHTHLELTHLGGKLAGFDSFADWITRLAEEMRTWSRDMFLNSAKAGELAALSSGTTLVGDVTSSGAGWDTAAEGNLRRAVFEEVAALSPADLDRALSGLEPLVGRTVSGPLLTKGVSPDAPYAVSPALYSRVAELARKHGMLLATHAAETRSEIEFLRSGSGELREMLNRCGALPADWKPPQMSPVQYLDCLGVLGQSCLLIHCNYLDQESIDRILRTRSSVVYCPRSHAFFGHDPHPVRRLLDSGINVALGTGSPAKNSSLSMLDEIRFLSKTRKDLKPEEIFRAATLNGAAALNFGGVLGRLRRGYWADMAVLRLPKTVGPRLLTAQILEGAGECIATIVQGRIVWRKE